MEGKITLTYTQQIEMKMPICHACAKEAGSNARLQMKWKVPLLLAGHEWVIFENGFATQVQHTEDCGKFWKSKFTSNSNQHMG